MKCWSLEVTRTFILCMGAIGQKHKVPRAQSWNGSSWKRISCCLCWFDHHWVCHRTNLPQNWIVTIPRANSFMLKWVVRQGSCLPPKIPDFGCCWPIIASAVAVSWQGQLTQIHWDIFSTFSCMVSSHVWWTVLTTPGTGFQALFQDTQSNHTAAQTVKY